MFRRFIISLALLCSAPFSFALAPVNDVDLEPTTTQELTALEILEKLNMFHFASVNVDDNLSSRLFDEYLDSLDPSRLYLSQQDVAEFSKYRFRFDDLLKHGELDAAFDIFNRYHHRNIDRLQRNIDMLPTLFTDLKFDSDEVLLLDRSKLNWPESEAEFDDVWQRRIKYEALSLKLADKPIDEIEKTITKRYQNSLDRAKQIVGEDVFQLFINSLTSLYDPHTSYFSPRVSENFNINMRLSLEGIGAVLQREDEFTKVVRLVKGGPADKQGELKASDRITAVAQGEEELVDVVGWRLDEVVDLIRGPKDSVVRLEVIPTDGSDDDRKIITIQRNEVKLEDQSAQSKVIEVPGDNGETIKLGVIQVPAFYVDFDAWRKGDPNYRSTTRDVKRLLDDLIEKDRVAGIVIDLRENGGGSLQEANQLTGLFIEAGPTVQIRKSNNHKQPQGKPYPSAYYEGPLVVMINRLSASASEIFAGALQDYQRAVIVGEQSFGKGTVQSLAPLESGQLKLTESKFYRISGASTQHRGVLPDVEFPQLYSHEEIGESALDNALPWDKIDGLTHPTYGISEELLASLRSRHQKRSMAEPDLQYLQKRFALIEERRERQTVPLNEAKLKALREADKQALNDLENQRRAAKGLPLLKPDELEKPDEIADEQHTATANEEQDEVKDSKDDYLLIEAGKVLADAIALTQKQLASSQ